MAGSIRFGEVAARLAACQHGVVSRQQLLSAGVVPATIDRRSRSGWLRRLHRGVYLVGPIAPPRAPEMAACLACGPNASVSHPSAARLWELLRGQKRRGPVHVTVAGGVRRRPGVRVHRVDELPDDETTRLEGIPVTTPERTLLDLAGFVSDKALERAWRRRTPATWPTRRAWAPWSSAIRAAAVSVA